jgi:hypothetical protein
MKSRCSAVGVLPNRGGAGKIAVFVMPPRGGNLSAFVLMLIAGPSPLTVSHGTVEWYHRGLDRSEPPARAKKTRIDDQVAMRPVLGSALFLIALDEVVT